MNENRKKRNRPGETPDADERAKVLAAFTAMAAPTGADADAAASRLGVGKLQLYRLARAWRIHGRVAMNLGEARRDPAMRPAAIAAAEGALDLSQFAPGRRDEIRRRIGIIGRYLREDTIARSASDRYAAEWGTSYNTFRRAVTAWLLSPVPESIPGISEWTWGRARNRGRIDPAAMGILERILADAGPDAGDAAVARRVARACHDADVVPPSSRFVARLRAERAREANASIGIETALCLDRVMVVPSENGLGDGPPFTLTLLFGALTGRIVAHVPFQGPPGPSLDARALARHLAADRAENDLLLEMSLPPGDGWGGLEGVLRSGGVGTTAGAHQGLRSGRLSAISIGTAIDGVRIRPISRRRPTPTAATGLPPAIHRALARAVDGHNAGRSSPPMGLGPRGRRAALATALLALADEYAG